MTHEQDEFNATHGITEAQLVALQEEVARIREYERVHAIAAAVMMADLKDYPKGV